MQLPRPPDLSQLAPKATHALPDHAAIGFDLRFARTPEEAESAALPFEVGPASDEAALLIVQMRKLDLQPAFSGRGSFSENFEDQRRSIDDLAIEFRLEVALLDRRQRSIHDDEIDLVLDRQRGEARDLAAAEEGSGADLADGHQLGMGDHGADRLRQPDRLCDPLARLKRATNVRDVGTQQQDARAARRILAFVAREAQRPGSSASFMKIDRALGLHGRDRVLVDQLDRTVPSQQDGELII